MNLRKIIQKPSQFLLIAFGFLLVLFIGALDYLTGFEFSFSLFYLIPIFFVTWLVGRVAGILMAGASAIAWFMAEFLTLLHYTHPAAIYWNALMILGFFLMVAVLLSALKNSVESENKLAREIQQGLLPKEILQAPGYEISGAWHPSRVVSGDYFDVLRLNESKIALCIGDVAGHDIPAAILMSNLQAAVKIFAPNTSSPRELCRQLNRLIASNVAPDRFITFFYGVLDIERKTLQYTNAGHNPPIIVRRDGLSIRLTEGGAVLGVFEDWNYQQGEIALASGDRVLLFTDGVVEITNAEEKAFGDELLIELLAKHRGLGAAALQKLVIETVAEFSRGHFEDDVTLVTMAVDYEGLKVELSRR